MEGFYPVCEHGLSSGTGITVHDTLHDGLVDNALGHRETLVSQGCIFGLNSLKDLFHADFLLGMNLTSSRENHDILA